MPWPRLEIGMFCSNCLACAIECYYQCDLCNRGDWVFCSACVDQGKCCTHPLLPMRYKSYEPETALSLSQHTPSWGSYFTDPETPARGSFEPLRYQTKCDICLQSIESIAPRFHCFSCTPSNLYYLQMPGHYDVCYSCYRELEMKRRISPENGQKGWRRCLKGHRMVIVGFEDRPAGRYRVVLNDLVGGKMLREEPIKSEPGFNLERWSWSNGAKSRHVDRNMSLSLPIRPGGTTDFPPDGGVGTRAEALWSWFPQEGNGDELLFPAGAEVTEIVDVNGDWSFGVYMGASGLFPTLFVKPQKK